MHILILGAGPAGAACAIHLRKAGIDVTLLDREMFPRHAPGETLHPGIEPLLHQLGVFEDVIKENYIRHKGIVTEWAGETILNPYHDEENWLGYQLFRETFDKILLSEAISLGAKFILSTSSIVNINNGIITSVVTSLGEIKADYYIDATGNTSLLNRTLKIGYKYNSPKLIAYYGYVFDKTYMDKCFNNPRMIWDNNGWIWIARVKENLINWNTLSLATYKQSANWLPEELKDYEPLGARRAVDVTWRIANHTARYNYFLIGDAAFVLDPSSSHGVLKAIMSGIMVASLIKGVEDSTISKSKVSKYYHDWISNWYQKDTKTLKSLYAEHGLTFNI